MGDERRWAARYQFLEQLWRGRDRIVCDGELEAALHADVEGPLAGLLDELVPRDADAGTGRAWVALHAGRRAAGLSRVRAGTVFASLDDAVELGSDEDWGVALVNLGDASIDEALDPFLEVLAERVEDNPARSVVLTLGCGDDEDACYEALAELVEELFEDGHIYGLTRPGMAAFYDFGPVLEAEAEAEDGTAAIEVDNSLGSEAPRFEAFVAVIGPTKAAEGLTFVELPARWEAQAGSASASASLGRGADPAATRAELEELAALRVQLAEAQKIGDRQAIDRQRLLEELERAEDRIAGLEEELDLGEGDEAEVQREHGERLDEALAREQSLRWEVERLRGELEHQQVRPVDELEAEVASLRAQLAQAERELDELELEDADEARAEAGETEAGEVLAELADALDADMPTPAQAREWMQARGRLEQLLRKLERGGQLSALELHRELRALLSQL